MKIRTITAGLDLALHNWRRQMEQTWQVLQQARQRCEEAGYEVQTLRIALAPFLPSLERGQRQTLLQELDKFCRESGLEFLSLGTLHAGELEPPEVVEILAAYPAFNFSTTIAEGGQVLASGVQEAARIISGLATATLDGLCNFRYAAIASCPPGIPFFPAAYHEKKQATTLALGMQMPDVALAAVRQAESGQLDTISNILSQTISAELLALQEIMENFSLSSQLKYAGIDVSLAPMAAESVAAVVEAAGLGRLGEAGTLAVCAAITAGLKAVKLKTVGYNGLMLAVLEDALLGQRAAEGLVDVQKLLMYSAVCGTGLDVVPVPGTATALELERLLYDVAFLSARYNKPLSARLFPVPGKQAGELTEFNSPYLTNTRVMKL